MRIHNLYGIEKANEEEEASSDESDEDEDDEKKPQMELAMVPHYGGINRVRVSDWLIMILSVVLVALNGHFCKLFINR